MSGLKKLIGRLEVACKNKEPYLREIRHPLLLIKSLKELEELTGNEKVKESVSTQITHLIMNKIRAKTSNIHEDTVMLNTILYGDPGVGKTLIGTKLAKIWYSLGFLKRQEPEGVTGKARKYMKNITNGDMDSSEIVSYVLIASLIASVLYFLFLTIKGFYQKAGLKKTAIFFGIVFILIITALIIYFWNSSDTVDSASKNIDSMNDLHSNFFPKDEDIIKIVSKSDFVGKYVGWSDKKTLEVLNSSLGKVLFVDEAYSLLNGPDDKFGIDVLDTLNLFLSQHPNEIIVIFAGYKNLIDDRLFSVQPGLKRRFMWKFECGNYTPHDLFNIFNIQLEKKGWNLCDKEKTEKLFLKYHDCFPAFGGDTERLAFFSEIEYSKDYLDGISGKENCLTPSQIERGIKILKENNIEEKEEKISAEDYGKMLEFMKRFNM